MNPKLGPMKYQLNDRVVFKFQDEVLKGRIVVADFGGSLEMLGKCHSYDLRCQRMGQGWLIKHVPENDIIGFQAGQA
ncbi:hypothetical protein [Levilactobacillus tujiorum]|uniref:hypothetical protein n=1 Tax=Levilactobacillus tujiorum TaxID=2912243 RepID=UPI0014575B88|nr:hypothetical protein [Levilactobacillus tujiorum]NLR31323.1 hypothetical protein [Levilactobacillus tujiorum]